MYLWVDSMPSCGQPLSKGRNPPSVPQPFAVCSTQENTEIVNGPVMVLVYVREAGYKDAPPFPKLIVGGVPVKFVFVARRRRERKVGVRPAVSQVVGVARVDGDRSPSGRGGNRSLVE